MRGSWNARGLGAAAPTPAREDLNEVDAAQVRVRPDVHALVEAELLIVDPRDVPDRDSGREERLQLVRARPRRNDGGPLAHAVAPRDEVEQQVAGPADGGLDDPRDAAAAGVRGDQLG